MLKWRGLRGLDARRVLRVHDGARLAAVPQGGMGHLLQQLCLTESQETERQVLRKEKRKHLTRELLNSKGAAGVQRTWPVAGSRTRSNMLFGGGVCRCRGCGGTQDCG